MEGNFTENLSQLVDSFKNHENVLHMK